MEGNQNQTWTELTPVDGMWWASVISNQIHALFISIIQGVPCKSQREPQRNRQTLLVSQLSCFCCTSAASYVKRSLVQHAGFYSCSHLCSSLDRANWTLCVCSWEKATTECPWCDLIPGTRWAIRRQAGEGGKPRPDFLDANMTKKHHLCTTYKYVFAHCVRMTQLH